MAYLKILLAIILNSFKSLHYLRIKWNFILEKPQWCGGFYERMVRSIKNTLKEVVVVSSLDYKQLNTALVQRIRKRDEDCQLYAGDIVY